MALKKDDVFPLWSFGYMETPERDLNKVMTSRGRTPQEAWMCIQVIGKPAFLEPKKVGLLACVRIDDKENYCKTHPYDWLHDAPLWLKIAEGAPIW